jgi:LuxR family quorum-sensing transcriptional regulator LasR
MKHESMPCLAKDNSLNVNLSSRQKEVLIWTARGKTTWETSVILKCAEATVNYHLKQVFRKLQATNKSHAVSLALGLGLLWAGSQSHGPR